MCNPLLMAMPRPHVSNKVRSLEQKETHERVNVPFAESPLNSQRCLYEFFKSSRRPVVGAQHPRQEQGRVSPCTPSSASALGSSARYRCEIGGSL
jgi:hypothetical protein